MDRVLTSFQAFRRIFESVWNRFTALLIIPEALWSVLPHFQHFLKLSGPVVERLVAFLQHFAVPLKHTESSRTILIHFI